MAFLSVILHSSVFICFTASACTVFTKIFILRHVRNPLHNPSCFNTYISLFFNTEYLQDFVTQLNIRFCKYLLCEFAAVIDFHTKYAHGRYDVVCIVALYGPSSPGIESQKPQAIILFSKSSRTRQEPNQTLFQWVPEFFPGSRRVVT